jgi:spore coat protein F
MPSIVAEMFGTTTDAPANQTLCLSSIAAADTSAATYLAATLTSTTPELRRLFSEYLTQSVIGQEALVGLAVKKGWLTPYDSLQQQISAANTKAKSVLDQKT